MSVFKNLSKFTGYKRIEWWFHAYYFRAFGISVNVHPNRIRQYWTSPIKERNG